MPPKSAKRGSVSSASKRGGRGGRGISKGVQSQQQHDTAEEVLKVEEKQPIVVAEEEQPKAMEEEHPVVEEKQLVVEEKESVVVVEDKAIDMNQMAPEAVEEASHLANGLTAVKSKKIYFLFFTL